MTANGASTTSTPAMNNTRLYNVYHPRRKHYQYDYRHIDGELFSKFSDLVIK